MSIRKAALSHFAITWTANLLTLNAPRYQDLFPISRRSACDGISAEAPCVFIRRSLPVCHFGRRQSKSDGIKKECERLRSPKFVTSVDFSKFTANVTLILCGERRQSNRARWCFGMASQRLACLACLPACMPACRPACLPAMPALLAANLAA